MQYTINRHSKFEYETDHSITFTSPSGKISTLTPFSCQPIQFTYDNEGAESVQAIGAPKSVIRFYPDECGTYHFDCGELTCIESSNHGYVTVSQQDPRYFAYSDGTGYTPIGINLAFITPFRSSNGSEFGCSGYRYLGMRQYESWFRQCHQNGVNLVRIWLGHEYFSPDTEQAGIYDPVQFSKIDALFDLAERYQMKLKLTLEQFRFFDYEKIADSDSYSDDVFRKFRKRLYLDQTRCENITEWLDEAIWREKWLDKVRQLSYRYSGNPTLFGIELWNEMNCLPWESTLAWNRYMLPIVKKLFPQHLVMNSLGSCDSDHIVKLYKEFVWEYSDIKQMHRYLDQGSADPICHENPIALVWDGIQRLADPEKPFLVAETGAVNNCHSGPFRYYNADHRGMIFCDTVYTPIFCGAAGCGHIWHWDGRYVESKNLYRHFKPIQQLLTNIEFDKEHFIPEKWEDEHLTLLLLRGTHVTLGYLRNNHDNWMNVLRDLLQDQPIRNYHIPLSAPASMMVLDIMDDHSNKISYADGYLNVDYMNYGVLLRFES